MIGFTVIHNGESIDVGVEEGGLCSIQFHAFNGLCGFVYISSVNYGQKVRNVWLNKVPLSDNDSWKIIFRDIDTVSEPMDSTVDEGIGRAPSPLDAFRELENYLKEKGLI